MSKSEPQNLKSHGRFDPSFHFVLFFILVANLIVAIVHLVHHNRNFYAYWLVVLSLAVFILVFKLRLYPLKVQDRVIRLEERLRLQALAPAEWHSQIYRLTEDQLIGLRFAADDEVVELAKQALEHNLNRKQIKERIKDWRADYWRV
jgi:c-di-AMP phosphodiesterase-like protein